MARRNQPHGEPEAMSVIIRSDHPKACKRPWTRFALEAIGLVMMTVVVFWICETLARAWAPEFAHGIFSEEVSRGKRRYFVTLNGVPVRISHPSMALENRPSDIVFVGDSITDGHGLAYEDTYYGQLQRTLDALSFAGSISVEAAALQGSNYVDNLSRITKMNASGRLIYYQFNYNDIVKFQKDELRAGGLIGDFNRFRAKYLDRSVFLRIAQHVGGWLKTRTSGTCEERGLDALGSYTWTFGARPFRKEAEEIWADFEQRLREVADHVRSQGGELRLLLVPILYQVDKVGYHPRYNYLNRDFQCATIDPKDRLRSIAQDLGIAVVDAEPAMTEGFQARLKEGNFEPFYFHADDNHITATASRYVVETLLRDIVRVCGRERKPTGIAACRGIGR